MLKGVVRDMIIVVGLVVLWASTSRSAMEYISNKRDGIAWWCTYPCKNGDLVSMSYLDAVRRFNPPPDKTPYRRPVDKGIKNTVLYLHGDSYTWPVRDTNFSGLAGYHYLARGAQFYYKLDTTKRNVLLIEVTERMVRDYFANTRMMDEVKDSAALNATSLHLSQFSQQKHYAGFPSLTIDTFFNKNINQNLQCNLFNYNFIIPMFEYKAALNYYLFNRASGDVVISNDRNFLFLKQTVSKDEASSSYGPLSRDEVSNIVKNFNTIYDHYTAEGFSEIYLSIIPNPATIMQPEGYNQLIPLIQKSAGLKMTVLDMYAEFRNTNEVLYLPGDTHWNKKGIQRWVDRVNAILLQ
jgi:hypothetical protein